MLAAAKGEFLYPFETKTKNPFFSFKKKEEEEIFGGKEDIWGKRRQIVDVLLGSWGAGELGGGFPLGRLKEGSFLDSHNTPQLDRLFA